MLRTLTADNPDFSSWRVLLAALLARSGREAEASTILDDLMGADLDPYSDAHCMAPLPFHFGRRYRSCRDARAGGPEYALLAPYAGRVPNTGVTARPSVTLSLATLASRARWPEMAKKHFADAHSEHEHLDAPLWLARSQLEWGRFLLDQDETERARRLLAQAREGAERIGAADIVVETTSLLST